MQRLVSSWVVLGGMALACTNEVPNPVSFDPDSGSSSTGLPEVETTGGQDDTTGGSSEDEGSTSSTGFVDEDGSSSTTGPGEAVCGNGVVEEGEPCDDGNQVNNDGCSNDCATPGLGVWAVHFAGQAGGDDHAYGVATDSAGNIVVAGTTRNFNGNVDIRVAKHSPEGNVLWAQQLDGGLQLDDFAYDVAVDSQNNVIVTGTIYVVGTGFDMWLAKYDGNGALQWQRTHAGPSESKDEGRSVTVDADDNILVGGAEFVLGEGFNAWLAKYDPSGNQLWTASHNGPHSSSDDIAAIDIDGDGNIVVAGKHRVSSQYHDIFVGKYDPSGNELWVVGHDGPQGTNDFANGIAALPDGSVVVTGATQVSANISNAPVYDLWLGKFDGQGNLVWEESIDGPLGGDDFGEAVVVDSLGNYVVVGALAVDETVPFSVWNGNPPQRLGWIRKFGPNDEELWTYQFGPQSRWAWAYSVAVDAIDNVFVAGQVLQANKTDIDQILLKVSP